MFYENIITISRAFFKLSEILISFDIKIPPTSTTLHLCEAPGGFVQSSLLHFNDNLQSFVSVSLDSFIKFHKDIRRNKKGTVIIEDITSVCGSDAIHEHTPEKGYEFITADGAFDVSDNYEEQERRKFPEVAAVLPLLECFLGLVQEGRLSF